METNKRKLKWIGISALLYVLLGWFFRFALDTALESSIFLLLVLVNIAIAFMPQFRICSTTVFLDMTVCFVLSHLVVPGRIAFRGFVGGDIANWLPLPAFFRDTDAIVINMVSLIVILTAYWIAKRKQILTSHGTRGGRAPVRGNVRQEAR